MLSVLMTAYNREAFIKEAIESVLASTYRNFELIVVDDCSTDATYEISVSFEAVDPRIKVFRNEVNLGDYPNRNRAASYARGKYIKFLDSDDIIYPHGLEVMVLAMESFPEAGLGIHFPDPNLQVPYPQLISPRQVFLQQFAGSGFFFTGPSGAIIKRESFYRAGEFSGQRFQGDFQCWLNLGMREPVVIFQPGLVWWRIHSEQEFQQHEKRPGSYLKVTLDVHREFLDHADSPLLPEERRSAKKLFVNRQARKVLHLTFFKGRPASAARVFKYSRLKAYQIFKGLMRSGHFYDIKKELKW